MSDPVPTIVVVEDEPSIRRFVKLALEAQGYRVYEAESVQRGLIEAGTRQPDLVLLDLGLPDADGMDLIRDLRGWSEIPIIVVSARSDEADKIAALDAGADDYLTKPFGAGELLARVRSQLRRRAALGDTGGPVVEFGDIRVDLGLRQLERAGRPVHLTPIEFRLLAFLLAHPNRVLTHQQLLKQVWGPSHTDSNHYVRIYMGNLRKKLEDDPSRPQYIVTETGVGYRFLAK